MMPALLRDTLHLFFPHNCLGCGTDVLGKSDILCERCLFELPYTGYEAYPNNPIERMFYGRVPLVSAYSDLYFNKGFVVQQLMHALKYKGQQNVGEYIGRIMGGHMLASGRFNADVILPLPLFAAKLHKRGYNQAKVIANGISATMHIPVLDGTLTRHKATETQTKKHRAERWHNVAESFSIVNPQAIAGKHVILIDDVLTTGATLDAACQVLLPHTTQISIATMAYASK